MEALINLTFLVRVPQSVKNFFCLIIFFSMALTSLLHFQMNWIDLNSFVFYLEDLSVYWLMFWILINY